MCWALKHKCMIFRPKRPVRCANNLQDGLKCSAVHELWIPIFDNACSSCACSGRYQELWMPNLACMPGIRSITPSWAPRVVVPLFRPSREEKCQDFSADVTFCLTMQQGPASGVRSARQLLGWSIEVGAVATCCTYKEAGLAVML